MDSISRGYKLAQMARERAKRNLQFSGPEVKPDDAKKVQKKKRQPLREIGCGDTTTPDINENPMFTVQDCEGKTPCNAKTSEKKPLLGIRRLDFGKNGKDLEIAGIEKSENTNENTDSSFDDSLSLEEIKSESFSVWEDINDNEKTKFQQSSSTNPPLMGLQNQILEQKDQINDSDVECTTDDVENVLENTKNSIEEMDASISFNTIRPDSPLLFLKNNPSLSRESFVTSEAIGDCDMLYESEGIVQKF